MLISTKGLAAALASVALGLSAFVFAAAAAPPRGGGPTIVVWADEDRVATVTEVATDWASLRGINVRVVEKTFGDIKDSLETATAADAPDVIVAAHTWTAELASKGLVVPLNPTKPTLAEFPSSTLDAFSTGTAVKRLYGAPVEVENIGLVVNTKLVKVPTTFAELEREAIAFRKRRAGNLAIAVQQGTSGDAYHMYPFFSGLGGYVFGTNVVGNLDVADIGVANPILLRNASLIDRWNRERLVNAKVDASRAENAFLSGQAAFWVTGPWNLDAIRRSGLKVRVIQIPRIARPAVPFISVLGFMVTKYAAAHGTDAAAKDLVASYLMGSAAQEQLAGASTRFPANTQAGARVTDPLVAQFGRASKGGVPIPNVSQMDNVWPDLGAAWVRSTKGAGATKATFAFRAAAKTIADKIG
jgi:arabinogalactan oligomer/maltooligosaccharide transport system substrate-binding protein